MNIDKLMFAQHIHRQIHGILLGIYIHTVYAMSCSPTQQVNYYILIEKESAVITPIAPDSKQVQIYFRTKQLNHITL